METLNPLEATILDILKDHKGRKNAIHRKDLVAKITNSLFFSLVNERMIRKTLKHLVERHFEWIGSCPNGYFMVMTDKELLGVCDYYDGYGLSALHISARLRKISLPTLLGQLSLKLDSGSSPE